MQRILTCCLLFLFIGNPLCAQRAFRLPWTKSSPKKSFTDINISAQLSRRAENSFVRAKYAQAQLPPNYQLVMGKPIQRIYKTGELNAKELYPSQPFLKTSGQTGNYLVSRNNRLFLSEIRRMKQIGDQIDKNLPRLQEEALATKQPQNFIDWLAEIIPLQTTQLFIGEVHGYNEIYGAVAQLMKNLRRQYAEREIILFTEFLPENFTWSAQPQTTHIPKIFHKYFPIWDQALQSNIPVIGLELPSAGDDECTVRCLDRTGVVMEQSVWATLEGVRLRNERWQKTLAQYRTQYPQALFVVYAGADHVMYNRPFTLANTPQEQPFVAVLYPNQYLSFESTGRFTSTLIAKPVKGPLEKIADLDFQRPVIKWQSPDLPAVAGFDARIKVPVQLQDLDY